MDTLDILFHPLSNKLRRPTSLPFYSAKIFEVGFKVFYTIVFGDLHTNSLQLNGRIITFKYAENGPALAISNIDLQIIFFREMIQQHVLCYGSISMTRNKASSRKEHDKLLVSFQLVSLKYIWATLTKEDSYLHKVYLSFITS